MDSVGSSKLFPFSWTSTYRSSVRKTRLLINIFSASVTGKKKRRSTFWLIIDPGEKEPHRRTQGEKKGKQKKTTKKRKNNTREMGLQNGRPIFEWEGPELMGQHARPSRPRPEVNQYRQSWPRIDEDPSAEVTSDPDVAATSKVCSDGTERDGMLSSSARCYSIIFFSFFFLRLYFLAIDDRSSGHKPLVTRFLGLFLCQCWFSLWALRPLRPLATHFGSRPIRWGIHYSWRLTGLSFACSSYWVLTPSRSWLTWVLTPLLDGILHHVRGLVLKCDCIFYCEPN